MDKQGIIVNSGMNTWFAVPYLSGMRPARIFSILVIYILLQFGWWSYLLVNLNDEVYEHRIENVHLKTLDANIAKEQEDSLLRRLAGRKWMIIGEGTVFLGLLGWVSYQTLRSFRKEVELARLQKNFLLSITHEFKSPLASIKLYLQTIQKHDLDKEKQESFIEKAINDTERLDNLVENTLLANMIDHKGYSFNRESVNLSALVRLIVQKFSSLPALQHNITSDIQDSITINADKTAIILVLNNLIENAIKYSPAETEIKILLQKKEGGVVLSVADNGSGIPLRERKKIFQKFYRLGNEETRKTKGTGLGLYLTKYIVEHHDGIISIHDNQPKGSVFEIRFAT